MIEARSSVRVWKTTLTFSPAYADAIKAEAQRLARVGGGDWFQDRSYDEQFGLLQKAAGRYLTLALKRMRKAGLKFRYLVTAEFHKSGVPHFHGVFHELLTPIRKREWEARWPYGFSKFKLVPIGAERDAVRYATKYVAKDSASRIRASVRYGVDGEHGSGVAVVKQEPVAIVDREALPFFPEKATDPKEVGPQQSGPSEARLPGPVALALAGSGERPYGWRPEGFREGRPGGARYG